MGLRFVGDWLPREGPDYRGLLGSQIGVGNLECAITHESAASDKAYDVRRDPSILSVLRDAGFGALSLANNHTADAGSRVLSEMAERLQAESGVASYGLRRRPHAELLVDGRRCAVIGCLERSHNRNSLLFPEEAVEIEIRTLRGDYDAVFATPHWGKEGEYTSYPSPRQRRLARRWIEAGADGVFGHHSHTLQGKEIFDGRPVFYSLGNFDFDHEEGRNYALTRVGLAVEWRPASPERWKEHYIWHGNAEPRSMADDEVGPLTEHLQRISERLIDRSRPWNAWSWARSVGPVYMKKSRSSWAKRLSRRPRLLTAAKWLAWNGLPTTLLLRAGSWLPDRPSQFPFDR